MVKGFLSQKGVSFEERDVSRSRAFAQELVRISGQMAVPVTVINGQAVVGFDRARLEQIISQMQPGGQKPSFGASVADASKITARLGTGIKIGAYIGKVRPDSAAARVGLAAGDIVTELNMKQIAGAEDFEQAISRMSAGSRCSITFLRNNRTMTAEGTL